MSFSIPLDIVHTLLKEVVRSNQTGFGKKDITKRCTYRKLKPLAFILRNLIIEIFTDPLF